MTIAPLTPREVTELSGTPRHVVEKAIEERVLRVQTPARAGANGRRMLPMHAVAYAVVVSKLDLRLTVAHKKRLLGELAQLKSTNMHRARVELAPAVEIDIGCLVGDVLERAERYRTVRDASIQIDDAIMGGTPIIRGTRMTVYSVLGRIDHGETIDDVLADNPDLSRDTIEAAATYARTHPLMGRPTGRPWAAAV
jgi:uncharacterized protein (DUF433 family)